MTDEAAGKSGGTTTGDGAGPGLTGVERGACGFLLLAALFLLTELASGAGIFLLTVVVALTALPMALVFSYLGAARTAGLALRLKPGSLLLSFLGRRFAPNFFAFAASLVLALCLLVNLGSLGPADWLPLLLSWPVFCLVYWLAKRRVKKEAVDWLVTPWSLRAARLNGPFVMLLIWCLLKVAFSPPHDHATMAEAQAAPFADGGSAIMECLGGWVVLLGGFRDFTFGRFFGLGPAAWFGLLTFSAWSMFFGLFNLFPVLFLTRADLRRCFSPPSGADNPGRTSPWALAGRLAAPFLLAFALWNAGSREAEDRFEGRPPSPRGGPGARRGD
ncbi:MAG: hypothetical protein LBO05_07190 [Deltaproteobacteria bacterium]|jgi:hypothetical protein|nr:hypothetical protein [Deltaproteobacteria bacterium]